jgi:hypothetical protein
VYTVKDSFAFAEEMGRMCNKGYFMASFDVTSLFTNIPVPETINIILSSLFINDSDLCHGFSKKDFKTLLELCTKDNVFIFNDKMYKQVDGAPMGGGAAFRPLLQIYFCLFMKLIGLQTVRKILNQFFIVDTWTTHFYCLTLSPTCRFS